MDAYTNKNKKRNKKRRKQVRVPKGNKGSSKIPSNRGGLIGKLQDFWNLQGAWISSVFKILLSIIAILLVCAVYFDWFNTTDVSVNEKKGQANVKYTIVKTQERPSIEHPKNIGMTVTILFKDVDVTTDSVKATLDYLYEKYTKEAKEKNKKLVVMEANIYNRSILLEKGYLPKGTYYKGLKAGFTETLNTKRPKERDYKNTLDYTQVTVKDAKKQYDELTGEIIVDSQKGEILDGNEFEKYLLLTEYRTLLDDNSEKAAQFYVAYDLRISMDSEEGQKQIKLTQEFIQEAIQNGEQTRIVEDNKSFWLSYKKTANKKYNVLRKFALENTFEYN